jgi:outer membrane protein assembly factor BamA
MHFTTRFWRSSQATIFAGARSTTFGNEVCCGDPSIEDLVATGQMVTPPGYENGYTVGRYGFELAIDSRRPRPARGTGIRVELGGEHAFDLSNPDDGRWVRYGGNVGAYLDVTGQNRTIGLTVHTSFADPIGAGDEVPFTELVTVGGEVPRHEVVSIGREGPLRGFAETRLLGRSAAGASLEYRWPIWVWLDGTIHFAMGNVFGAHLQGFDPDLLRMSFGLGVRAGTARDHSFDFLIAAGTDPIGDGGQVSSFRLVLGANRGF